MSKEKSRSFIRNCFIISNAVKKTKKNSFMYKKQWVDKYVQKKWVDKYVLILMISFVISINTVQYQ